jgi:hypothetical protein
MSSFLAKRTRPIYLAAIHFPAASRPEADSLLPSRIILRSLFASSTLPLPGVPVT